MSGWFTDLLARKRDAKLRRRGPTARVQTTLYVDTRRWVCPALCGCALDMTAAWADEHPDVGDDGARLSYRHPSSFTITALAIAHVCDAHRPLCFIGVATDPWPERTGYLRRPIENASPAESLYVWLWRYSARMFSWACGCHPCTVLDHVDGSEVFVQHPRYTVRCAQHRSDDDQHSAALADHQRLQGGR